MAGKMRSIGFGTFFVLLVAALGCVSWPGKAWAYMKGDMNCDGEIKEGDVSGFVLALHGAEQYQRVYPKCHWYLADLNGDGFLDFTDINPFVELLFKSGIDPCITPVFKAAPPEGGTLRVLTAPNCREGYFPNTSVRLKALPAAGYFFSGWQGAFGFSAEGILTVKDGEKSPLVTAYFSRECFTISALARPAKAAKTIRFTPLGNCPDQSQAYLPGTKVRISVKPGPKYFPLKWLVLEAATGIKLYRVKGKVRTRWRINLRPGKKSLLVKIYFKRKKPQLPPKRA